jgi:hypothetical protein
VAAERAPLARLLASGVQGGSGGQGSGGQGSGGQGDSGGPPAG